PGFETPNPHIPWSTAPVHVPVELTPLPSSGSTRMAGVSSFGFTGSNAHVVLEAPPQKKARSRALGNCTLPISAKSAERLRSLAQAYQARLDDCTPDEFGDLCFSAAVGRTAFEYRLAIEADDINQARDRLAA